MSQQVTSSRPRGTRYAPWRWLRSCVERLRAPIDFGPVGCDDDLAPSTDALRVPCVQSPTDPGDGSAATDHAPGGWALSEGTALRLRNGRNARVRPVGPADAEAVQAFVCGLSEASRRRRFCASIRELTPAMLAHLTRHADRRGLVLLAEVHDRETWCTVALAEYAAGPDAGTCELALVVADAWQGLGLGRALMGVLIQRARDAQWVRIVADVLCDNGAMLALGRAHGFVVGRSPYGPTMRRLERELRSVPRTDAVRAIARDAAQTGLAAAFAAS